MIGDKYRVNTSFSHIGIYAGDIGYVFNEYKDFDYPDKKGVQIIFENGGYEGFGIDEQEKYLEYLGFDERFSGYEFHSVLRVSKDFNIGYWHWDDEE